MRSRIEVEVQPSTHEEDPEVSDPIGWYFGQIRQFEVIKETEKQHRLARRIFRGQLALRALKSVQGSELLTSPQTECIRELLEDNTAQFLLNNYPTPPKKPEEQAQEKRSFLSVADRYIQWVDSKLFQASQQEVLMTQVEFASQGLRSFEEMVNGNLGLVVSIANKCYARNMSLLAKVSYGNEALMKAVARFDFRMGNRFSTFAIQGIRRAIWRGIEESDDTITIPVGTQRAYWRSSRQYGQGAPEPGDDPAKQEMQRIHTLKTPLYLSTLWRIGEGFREFGDSIPDPAQDLSEAVTTRVSSQEQVESLLPKLLQCLTPRELKMVRQHFGLDGVNGITLEAIGKSEGLTRQCIQQKLDEILHKMRRAAENGLPGVDKPDNHQPPRFTLTPRQVQVLQLAVYGLSNQAIADFLDNSTRTIKVHMGAIYQAAADLDNISKTNFKRVVELATQEGFIQLPEGQEITSRANAKKSHTPTRTT